MNIEELRIFFDSYPKPTNKIKFDRGSNKYHGRVKALAEGIRAQGIKF